MNGDQSGGYGMPEPPPNPYSPPSYGETSEPTHSPASPVQPQRKRPAVSGWNILISVVIVLIILFALPYAYGNSPWDILRGRAREESLSEQAAISAFGTEPAIAAVVDKVGASVVNIDVLLPGAEAIASGFFIRDGGYILTNNHVVQGASQITVTMSTGNSMTATVVGTDPSTDLAVVRVGANGLPAPLGDSSTLLVGETVVAFGSPEGLQNTVTEGIISALNRTVPDFHPPNAPNTTPLQNVIQTDAAINPGNSGGPLCDLRATVIGINTAIASSSGGNEGLGFSIPINQAAKIADSIIATGHP